MTETWTGASAGGIETQTVAGRVPVSIWLKINPIWWLGNHGDPLPPDWYRPGEAQWYRILRWYIRNPFVNFCDYVVGVVDRNYSVSGSAPVLIRDWLDVQRTGFKTSIIHTAIPLPYISFTGTKRAWLGNRGVLWHVGWAPQGDLSLKFNITSDDS